MKKLIVVVMALITIFSASVSAHAEQYVDWQVVDTITNIVYDSYNCCLTFHNTASPTPTMTNASGAYGTQKTTYNVLYALYETVSVNGASFQANVVMGGVFEWYEYGGYCWIKYDLDNSTNTFWVANKQGKILYCDAPTTSNGYTISSIAGAGSYYLTNRPVGTSGNGYLGDLELSYDNWSNIKTRLNDLSDNTSYYTFLYSVNGEMRYHIASLIGGTKYFVCNSSGQIFYYVKESADSGGNGGGSSFDATEVITAINSVYDAIDIGFWYVCNWLDAIQDNITSFNTDVLIMSQNMTNGFADLRNVGNTINTTLGTINSNLLYTGSNITSALISTGNNIISSVDTFRLKFEDYFHSLGKSYPQLMTVKLSGNDNLFEWNEGDIIQDIRSSNPDGEVHIKKTFLGDDSTGYEDVTLVNSEDGYKMRVDDNGYICFECSYPIELMPESLFVLNGYYGSGDGVYYDSVTNYKCTRLMLYEPGSYCNWINPSTGYISCYDDRATYLGYSNIVKPIPDGTCFVAYNWVYQYDMTFYRNTCQSQYERISTSVFTLNGAYDKSTGVVNDATAGYKCTPLFALNSNAYIYNLSFSGGSYISCFDENKIYLGHCNKQNSFKTGTYYVAYNWSMSESQPELYRIIDVPSMSPVLSFGDKNHSISVSLSHSSADCDYIYYDISSSIWNVYRASSKSSVVLPSADQEILNQTIYTPPNINTVPISDFTAASAPPLFYDGLNHIDIDGDTVVTIEYYHNGSWFDYMYSMMDKLYERINTVGVGVGDTIVNIENTVVDIVQDNDAFNVFYVEKSDGTTESVGDAATDAAKVVGEFLSIFYRLVFEDALSNADIIHDFEDVYTDSNTGVNVW